MKITLVWLAFMGLSLLIGGLPARAQTIQSVSLLTNHIIFEPVSGKIFATVPSAAGSNGNSLAIIDPTSGTILSQTFIGSEPDTLAASGDGQFVYVGLDGSNSIARYNVAEGAVDLSFYVGTDPNFGVLHAGDMAVLPGAPHSLAVLRKSASLASTGVAIYDDGVVRQNAITTGNSDIESLAFGQSASNLYSVGGDVLITLSVDAQGVTQSSVAAFNAYYPFVFDDTTGLLVDAGGSIINPAAGASLGSFFGPKQNTRWGVAADLPNSRAYFLTTGLSADQTAATVEAFDTNTFLPIGAVNVSGANTGFPSSQIGDLIDTSAGSFAFRSNNGNVFLLQSTSFVGLSGLTLSASVVPCGQSLTGTVQLNTPAPPGGITLNLSGNYQATVPATVAVAQGQTSATFAIATAVTDTSGFPFISASYGVQTTSVPFELLDQAGDPYWPQNVRFVDIGASAIAYSSATHLLYAAMPSSDLLNGNNILALDPVSGLPASSLFAGSSPDRIGVSSDGSQVYTSLDGASSIGQLPVANPSAYSTFPIQPGQGLLQVWDLCSLLNKPDSVVASLDSGGDSSYFAGVNVYESGVALPQVGNLMSQDYSLTAGGNSSTFYGFNTQSSAGDYSIFAVSPSGVANTKTRRNYDDENDFDYAKGQLFTTSGEVIDATSGAVTTRIVGIGNTNGSDYGLSVLPDVADGTLYFLYTRNNSDGTTSSGLKVYNLSTYAFTANYALPGGLYVGINGRMVRWAAGKLAFCSDSGICLVDANIPALSSISVSNTNPVGRTQITGTITLTNAAPIGGLNIPIASSSPSVAVVPSFAFVPQGMNTGMFAIQTLAHSSSKTATISATYLGVTRKVKIVVAP